MTKITMIAAAAENNALGKDNNLLWHLPDDFKRFKKLTTGHKIIMGRKTFESFPKPLPNRIHIIITRDKNYRVDHEDCLIVHSLEAALKLVQEDDLAFIIGGGEIYKQGEPHADAIELTRVHASFENADTFFPEIDTEIWMLSEGEYHAIDERHKFGFTYLTFVRKSEK
ncbi:dihydrofolate reductase [Aggregatimonas sangjinii]|uniref:Dihydrofolate reductase n=1 Tax=Aggregatimonas sangjinii TaxID=2583587 RepID=A0A5B7SPL3_9FLAO|nr:dihydrofolate reductase [Aggregatimonas sangjinii]QCW98932.1 dihydrofolate reductase [Aggregatimonas sangjinii]